MKVILVEAFTLSQATVLRVLGFLDFLAES